MSRRARAGILAGTQVESLMLMLLALLSCDQAKEAATEAAKAATTPDLPENEAGLAEGHAPPVGVVDLEQTRLGFPAPNSIKGMTVAWDPERKLLWHASIFSTWLIGHDPETGAPVRAIDMEVEGFNPNQLHFDAARDRMVYISTATEMIRAVDLDKGTLLQRIDVSGKGNRSNPTQASALDRATGRFWVWNAHNRTLNGYSFDGEPTVPLTGMTDVISMSTSPSGGKLALIDGTDRMASRVVVVDTVSGQSSVACQLTGQPPNRVVLMDDGSMILGGTRSRKVDASCVEQWALDMTTAPETWAWEGGHLLAGMEFGGAAIGKIGSLVAVIEPATGRLVNQVSSRWESQSISVDVEGKRAFVGNGGDGSATVLSLPTGAVDRTLPLASSADDVVVDSRTGDRYILSRLGGSRIYKWAKDGTVSLFTDQAAWPFALAVDPERRLLLAPSFFEARLYAWPLDGGQGFSLDLGIPGSVGDSIGDFAYDPATGRAAVVLPEKGWVSAVDVQARAVLFTRQFPELEAGTKAGPGVGAVAVANDSVYVGATRHSMIWRLDPKNGQTLASATVKSLAGAGSAATGAPPQGGPRGGGAPAEKGAGGKAGKVPPPTGGAGAGARPMGAPPGKQAPGRAGGELEKLSSERPDGKAGKPPRPAGQRPMRPEVAEGGQRPPRPAAGAAGAGAGQGEQRPPRPQEGGAQGQPPPGAAEGGKAGRGFPYAFGIIQFDAIAGRLFFGAAVLDPNSLVEEGSLPGAMKVLHIEAGRLLVLTQGADGVDEIKELDPTSFAVRRSWATVRHAITRAEGCYDPVAEEVVLADLSRARVTSFSVR